MIKTTPKNVLATIAVILVAALIYCFFYWPISPLGSQLQNMKLAETQAKLLSEKFKNDPRFSGIKMDSYPDYDGCLGVFGFAASEEEIYYITNAVESAKCPIGVYYDLTTSNRLFAFNWFDRSYEQPRIAK
jgi:hypothetical protein